MSNREGVEGGGTRCCCSSSCSRIIKAIWRAFMPLQPLLPLSCQTVSICSATGSAHTAALRWHGCAHSQPAGTPPPFQKQLSQLFRFKSSPPFPSIGSLQCLETSVCPPRVPPPPILTGVVAFDRQLLILNGKRLNPSLKVLTEEMASLESVGHRVLGFALTGQDLNFAHLMHKSTQEGSCEKKEPFQNR